MKLALGLLWWFISTYPMLIVGMAIAVAATVWLASRVAES